MSVWSAKAQSILQAARPTVLWMGPITYGRQLPAFPARRISTPDLASLWSDGTHRVMAVVGARAMATANRVAPSRVINPLVAAC